MRVGADRTGTTLLEFALVFPLFVALMLGVGDLGRYLLTQYSLDTLASATARALVVNCGQAGSNYGKLNAGCADDGKYGLKDAQKRNAAPFLYVGGQLPQISFDTTLSGQLKVTAALTSPFTFFLPVAGIIPGWSTSSQANLRNTLPQTAILYY